MKKLLFMRHGESEMNALGLFGGNQPHIQLTELGRKQAALAAADYDGDPITTIIASNLDRAQETAKIFATGIGFPLNEIKTDERIHEIDVGALTGQPDFGFIKGLEYISSGTDPSAETPDQVFARVTAFLRDIIPTTGDAEVVLFVAHAGIARIMRSLLIPVPLTDIAGTTIPNAEPFELPLDHLTEVIS